MDRRRVASKRADGRGHWPAGKPRSDAPPAERRRALGAVRRAQKHFSLREIARTLEVSDRTVRRWLAGEDQPTVEMCGRIAARLVAKRRKR